MEIKSNITQIITANDNFASLEGIVDNYYIYDFNLSVSKDITNSLSANRLIIKTYANNPKSSVALSLFSASSQTLNVLNQNSSTLINRIKQRSINAIVDISKARNSYLTSNSVSLGDLIIKYNNGVGYSAIENGTGISIKNNVYGSSNFNTQQELNEDRTVSQLSMDLLESHRVDPASVITRTYSSRTPYEINNGCDKSLYFLSQIENYSDQSKQIINHLLSDNSEEPIDNISIQTFDVSAQDIIQITTRQEFPIGALGEPDFYVMISVYDINDNLVQELVKNVNHRKNISLYYRIKSAPIFNVKKFSNGTANIFMQQTDINATGVRVYKTVFTETGGPLKSEQHLVGSYELAYGNTLEKTLIADHLGISLYRAISYNRYGDPGSDFTGHIIETQPESSDGSPRDNVFLSLHTEYTLGGVNIIISDISNNTSIIQLFKTELQADHYQETLIETFYIGGGTRNVSFLYFDNTIQEHSTYRYRCVSIDNKGQEFDCTGIEEIYYRPKKQEYAIVTVTPPIVTILQLPSDSQQLYDVTFSVDYAINKKLEDNLKEFLTIQGLIEYFGNDIKREQLKELLVTKIELRDLDSNEKSFLTYTVDTFVQSKTKYGYLNKNSRYSYELTTYTRNPITLLKSIVSKRSSTVRSNSQLAPPEYSFVPSVIDHPYALLEGTNAKNNGDEFVRFYGLNQLAFGDVTSVDYVKVDLSIPRASLNGLRAFLFNSKNVELLWSVNGNQEEISHFIIKRQDIITGKLDIVGKAHGINSINSFSYIDPIRYTEAGIFRYLIIIQYFDMTLSQYYTSNEVVIT